MKAWLLLLPLVLGAVPLGCMPIHMVGLHDVAILPAIGDGPVVAMPLGGGRCARGPHIAVVDVDGPLLNQDFSGPYSTGENPVAHFREKLDAIEKCKEVRAVVVRINTPGGDVTSTDIMWRDLTAFRERTKLPVVACLMNVGAGGGYYLATSSDAIVSHPTTVTGGIGVILNLYNLQDAMGLLSILPQPIKAGTLIDMGTVNKALPVEVRGLLQKMADDYHNRFRDVVQKSRPGVDMADAATFDGRVFGSQEALERKLIDRIGYVDDAIAMAGEMAGAPSAQPILFHRPNDPARSVHAATPNTPMHTALVPLSIPGLDRSRQPLFLYMWHPEPTVQKQSGR